MRWILQFIERRRAQKEIAEEIEAHIEEKTEDLIEAGLNEHEARQQARRTFGNRTLYTQASREVWGWTFIEGFVRDMKYALRQMTRSPGFSTIAILTLALGLGATTAMFSIINGVLLQPLKYLEPGRLYIARTVAPPRANLAGDFPVNARHFHQWRKQCRSCEAVSLVQFQDLTLVGFGEPIRLPALSVSFNFFRTLGVQPILGRDFLREEEAPGSWDKVILTDSLWRSRFASDSSIIGRAIQINGEPHTVVGVMPPGLHLPRGGQWGSFFGPTADPLIFRPLNFDASKASANGNLNYVSIIRLKPGVQSESATGELNALLGDFVKEFKIETTTTLIPLQQQVTREARSSLWLLFGTLSTVLLIVCVNVGNLMLVRTTSRHREAGVRMALGASRTRLFASVLQEALLLVAAGGLLGLALTYAFLKILIASAPLDLPRLEEVEVNWQVLLFAFSAVALSAIACGLLPAWRLARTEPLESMKAGSANSTEPGGKHRIRELLVSIEVALSAVLLIIGGLLLLSFVRVMQINKGFEVVRITTQDVSFLNPKYARGARRRFVSEMLAKFAEIPGVQAVGGTSLLPLRGEEWVSVLRDPDQRERPIEQAAIANFRFVTPNYWQAMGIPLKKGRYLDESDQGRPTAVISESAANYLWPDQNPLGRHVRATGPQPPSLEVVGVVGDVRATAELPSPKMVYEHYWRMQPVAMTFVFRTGADAASIASPIRRILSSADPEMAISPANTMEHILDQSVAKRRFQTNLAAAFALSALLLAAMGIYGLISFAVASRTSEIGIRIAVGASRWQLIRMVLRQGLRPVLIGIPIGLVCALSLSRLLSSQLFGIEPYDFLTIFAVVALLLLVAILACLIPAVRATRIDPILALSI